VNVRLEAGAIAEEVDVPGVGVVPVRYERCTAGWQAAFTLSMADVDDLAVVHRFVAASLHEARRTLPTAVAFLLGRPIDKPFASH
jgi:hypothetical protein